MAMRDLKMVMLHVLATQLQNWADFVFRQTEQPNIPTQHIQASSEVGGTCRSDNVESTDADNESGPPAAWLAKVKKNASVWTNLEGHSPQFPAAQAPLPAVPWAYEDIQALDTVREVHTPAVPQVKKAAQDLVENAVQSSSAIQGEAYGLVPVEKGQQAPIQPDMHNFFAPLRSSIERQAFVTSKSETEEPLTAREHQSDGSGYDHVKWGEHQLLKGSLTEDHWHRVGENTHYYNLQVGNAEPLLHSNHALRNAEQIQGQTHWPSLPAANPTNHQGMDWEMVRRMWERQQRLDDEQRGNSWNA